MMKNKPVIVYALGTIVSLGTLGIVYSKFKKKKSNK